MRLSASHPMDDDDFPELNDLSSQSFNDFMNDFDSDDDKYGFIGYAMSSDGDQGFSEADANAESLSEGETYSSEDELLE